MMPPVHNWVVGAEEDFSVASRLLRVRKDPAYATVRFHSQQCAEKYLKAVLQDRNVKFPWTHDLVELAIQIPGDQNPFLLLTPELGLLTKAAVEVRYSGEPSTKEEARRDLKIAANVREFSRIALKLPASNPAKAKRNRKPHR